MINSILKTKSISWKLKIENNKIYLENEKLEKEEINLKTLNEIMLNNILNKNKIASSLLLGKNQDNESIFIKRDSEEYKEYLKMKNFEKKELFPGNIFLYENEGSVEEFKFLGTLYENEICNIKNNIYNSNNIQIYFSKAHIAYNLKKKRIEFINTKQIIDLVNDIEEIIEELSLKNFIIKEMNKKYLFLEEIKKVGKNRYTIASINKHLKKSEIMFLFEENN
jgi:hypothetical protein